MFLAASIKEIDKLGSSTIRPVGGKSCTTEVPALSCTTRFFCDYYRHSSIVTCCRGFGIHLKTSLTAFHYLLIGQFAAITRCRRLVCARVQNHLPAPVGLLAPHGDVPSARDHGISVRVLAVSLKMAPSVAHISRRPHHCVGWRPHQLIVLGRPVRRFGNRYFSDQRRRSVSQRHAIVGKPRSECRATACCHILGKACLQVLENHLARLDRRVSQWIGRPRLLSRLQQLRPCRVRTCPRQNRNQNER